MKTLVVYQTVSGFTETYARWIAEDLSADLRQRKDVDLALLQRYDLVVYGAPLHAVGIAGVDLIRDNLNALANTHVVVFTTGASPPRPEVKTEVFENNFPPEQRTHVHFFYLRGGFDFNKLNFINKVLMKLMQWKIKRKPAEKRTADERGMLAAFDTPVDFTKRERVSDIVSLARSLAPRSSS
jgi:menaquinone-dependent protoporphyrinogen IX oxidase